MALVDERNQDDQSDAIEENDDRSEHGGADEVGLAQTQDDESDEESDENDESDGNDPIIP